jgi:hypothetical protein
MFVATYRAAKKRLSYFVTGQFFPGTKAIRGRNTSDEYAGVKVHYHKVAVLMIKATAITENTGAIPNAKR